jgi:hypothetical protein
MRQKRSVEPYKYLSRGIKSYLRENEGYHSVGDILDGISMSRLYHDMVTRVLYKMHREGQVTKKLLRSGKVGFSNA